MNSDAVFRAFVAVEITSEIRRKLSGVIDDLRCTGAHVGWVKPDNVHITFIFLGDITAESSAAVISAMDSVVLSARPVSCEINGLGYFGSRRSPRVIWTGVREGTPELVELQTRLSVALKSSGLETAGEKAFVPHLTIGRVRSNRNASDLVDAVDGYKDNSFGMLDVTSLVLMRSELKSGGPEYTVVHRSVISSPCRAG